MQNLLLILVSCLLCSEAIFGAAVTFGAPQQLSATKVKSNKIVISWTAPSPAASLSSYVLTYNSEKMTIPATATTYNITGLTTCTTYNITLAGQSSDSPSVVGPSSQITVTTIATKPKALTSVTGIVKSSSNIVWSIVDPITTKPTCGNYQYKYTLFQYGAENVKGVALAGLFVNNTLNAVNLQANTQFKLQVSVIELNSNHESPSITSNGLSTPTGPKPTLPKINGVVTYNVQPTLVSLGWTGNYTVPFQGYLIRINNGSNVKITKVQRNREMVVLTGLTSCTQYTIQVQAYDNQAQFGPLSASVNVTLPAPSPQAVKSISVVPSVISAQLTIVDNVTVSTCSKFEYVIYVYLEAGRTYLYALPTTSQSFKLNHLSASTKYIVTVARRETTTKTMSPIVEQTFTTVAQ